MAQKLTPGGRFHLATDWQDYAEYMMAVLSIAPEFINAAGRGNFASRPAYRPLTKFEQRGQRLGHQVWDLVFIAAPAQQSGAMKSYNAGSLPPYTAHMRR